MESAAAGLNWVDLLLGMAFVATLLIGLGLGFYRQFALAASLALGLFISGWLTDPLAASALFSGFAEKYGASSARLVAFLLLISTPVFLALLTFSVFPRMFGSVLRSCDTLCGGVAGLTCAVLLFWLVLFGASQYPGHWLLAPVMDSYLGSRLARAGCTAAEALPADFRLRMESQFLPAGPESTGSDPVSGRSS